MIRSTRPLLLLVLALTQLSCSARRPPPAATEPARAPDEALADAVGGPRLTLPPNAVEEFRIVTSGASARQGEQSTGSADTVGKPPLSNRNVQDVVAKMPGVVRARSRELPGPRRRGVTEATPPTLAFFPPPATTLFPTSGRPVQSADFVSPLDEPLSTFGVDVDTASWSIVRTSLRSGFLPPPEVVRLEEIVNAFDFDDPPPPAGDAFTATTEVARCPWNDDHQLVRIALKGREIDGRRPLNLVFLVDVSGSMATPEKLPLVQDSLRLLAGTLGDDDTVGLVVYAGAAGVLLEPTSDAQAVIAAVDRLSAGGSTAGGAGIQAAYALARQHFRPEAANRVILATDGDFNVGVSDEASLVALIERERDHGVFLTVLGFGTGNFQDRKMEQLADHGNGNYAYVDGLDEARRVLVDRGGGTLVTIAKDVKVQVEVNPERVDRYRLLGYENRVMSAQDFEDDAKDGGEIGAGHVVTALYEIVPSRSGRAASRRSARHRLLDGAASRSGDLLTVRLRWKEPDGTTSDAAESTASASDVPFDAASDSLRWAACAAAFGRLLRDGASSSFGWPELVELASEVAESGDDPRRAELVELARRAQALSPRPVAFR